MRTKEDIIRYCKTFSNIYEDYPFRGSDWAMMRCKNTKKSFACIYERNGHIWVNVKCHPDWIKFWRNAFASVVPAYHMNKEHWNSIILDGTIPDAEVRRMIAESYDLVNQK